MFSQHHQLTGRAERVLAPSAYVPPSVMMYSHDGFGLGHIRRNANIASRFVKEVPDANVLMLVGCPWEHLFKLPAGVDFLRLPSVVKVGTHAWRPRNLQVGSAKLRDLRSHLIKGAAERFMPQLFIVDHLPTGVWQELLPTLEMFQRLANPPKVILGLRDILDAPEVIHDTWRREGIYDFIATYYDGIFVYGHPTVFDTVSHYRLNQALPGKIHYCGYVCAEDAYQDRNKVREMLQLADRKFVVVTAGGGHDAYRMMESCMAAVRLMASEMNLHALFITGPLMDQQHREGLTKQSLGLPIQVISHVTDPLSYMNAADLVLTMAGYNSLIEAIHLRKKTLVIPRQGPSAEQRLRTEIFARLGLVQAADPRRATPPDLARCIVESLNAGPVEKPLLPMDGLESTVRRMTSLLARRWSSQVAAMA